MKIRISKPKLTFTEFFFILFVALNSGTLLKQEQNIASYGMILFYALFLFRSIILHKLRKNLIKEICCLVIVLVVWSAQYYLVGSNEGYIVVLQTFLLAFTTITFSAIDSNKNKDRIKCLIYIEFSFSIISSVIYFLIVIGAPLPVRLAENTTTYSVAYLGNYVRDSHALFSYKNCGIFWEHGMYQIYLNLMIIFFLYSLEGKRIRKYIIAYLVILVLTTSSTTGYLLCPILIVLYLFSRKEISIKYLLPIVVALIAVVYSLPLIVSNVSDKLSRGNSYLYRMNDLSLGFKVFLEKPIIGHGIVNEAYSNAFLRVNNTIRGNSNGLINILINFGLIGIAIYTIYLKRFIVYINNALGNGSVLVLVMWMIASIMTEPIAVHPFVFLMIGIGINAGGNLNDRITTKNRKQEYSIADTSILWLRNKHKR